MEHNTLPKVLATSVVRGAKQGQSHGGVFLVDLATGDSDLMLDWNTCDIDFVGRGADRGLRGIAFSGDEIFIAASDELFVFDRSFRILCSYRNRYLKHCHEIVLYKNQLFMTSTGYDSVLVFDIVTRKFVWGLHVRLASNRLWARTFDPNKIGGPPLKTELHINSVFCNTNAVMISGLHHDRLIRFREQGVDFIARLPRGTHNVQMYMKGLLYNDTANDRVQYVVAGHVRNIPVPHFREREIVNTFAVSGRVARAHFARGLCRLGDGLIAAGSSPSTIAVHDLKAGNTIKKVNLSLDIRNAIHGLEVWPYH